MASPTQISTSELYFTDGMPRVVSRYREEDDIMYVINRDGEEVPVWSDRRIKVNSRYDTHSHWSEWREKAYIGDPQPPQIKEHWDYHSTLDDALESAYQEQEMRLREGEQVPIILNER